MCASSCQLKRMCSEPCKCIHMGYMTPHLESTQHGTTKPSMFDCCITAVGCYCQRWFHVVIHSAQYVAKQPRSWCPSALRRFPQDTIIHGRLQETHTRIQFSTRTHVEQRIYGTMLPTAAKTPWCEPSRHHAREHACACSPRRGSFPAPSSSSACHPPSRCRRDSGSPEQ